MLLEQEKNLYLSARKEMIKKIEEKTGKYHPWFSIPTSEVEQIYCEVNGWV